MAGLYIHIPFCTEKCFYCDFFSGNQLYLIDSYVDALCREIQVRSIYIGHNSIDTVYFGGGTPSLLSLEHFETIFTAINLFFKVDKSPEITIECNPENINEKYIDSLSALGVNRISLGIQFLANDILLNFNRKHTKELILKALDIIERSSIVNISVDLIFSVPGISDEYLLDSLKILTKYDIKHISAYSLTIAKNSKLFWKIQKGEFAEKSEDDFVSQYNLIRHFLKSNDFIQYEVSNYAKIGYHSRHNLAYWNQIPYVGIGVSAHSYNKFSRQWNHMNSKKYIRDLMSEKPIICFEIEYLTNIQIYNEYIILKLRTLQGLSCHYIKSSFEGEIFDHFCKSLAILRAQNHFDLEGDFIIPKESDLLMADFLAKSLMF